MYTFFFFLTTLRVYGIIAPRPGIKPMPPAAEAQRPNHWIARKFPCVYTHVCKIDF